MTDEQQPEALRLADVLDLLAMDMKTPRQAAAELRRLHAENEDFRATIDYLTRENAGQIGEIVALKEQRDALLEALRMNAQSLAWLANGKCRGFHPGLPTADESLDAARSAIAKATGKISPVYTNPQPPRKPLTDQELNLIAARWHLHLLEGQDKRDLFEFSRAIEGYSASRKVTPLTDQQISTIVANHSLDVGDWSKNGASVARAIERAHGIGGEK